MAKPASISIPTDPIGSIPRPVDLIDAPLRLAAIIPGRDDAVEVLADNRIVRRSHNRAAENMFGFSASDMLGQSIRLIIPDNLQQEEDDALSRIRRGERVDHYQTVRRRKDGTLLPVSLTVSPIRSPEGTVIGASKIARDLSQLTSLNARLQQSDAYLAKAQRLSHTEASAGDPPQARFSGQRKHFEFSNTTQRLNRL